MALSMECPGTGQTSGCSSSSTEHETPPSGPVGSNSPEQCKWEFEYRAQTYASAVVGVTALQQHGGQAVARTASATALACATEEVVAEKP
jgi:hypothetical protein